MLVDYFDHARRELCREQLLDVAHFLHAAQKKNDAELVRAAADLVLRAGVVGSPTARGSLRQLALPGSDACKDAGRADLVAIETLGKLSLQGDVSYERDDATLMWLSLALVGKTPCALGAEASTRGAEYVELGARFGPGAAAVARVGIQTASMSCTVSGVEP